MWSDSHNNAFVRVTSHDRQVIEDMMIEDMMIEPNGSSCIMTAILSRVFN